MSIVLALRGNMAREDEVTPERPGPPFLSALIKWERSTDQRRRDVARFVIPSAMRRFALNPGRTWRLTSRSLTAWSRR